MTIEERDDFAAEIFAQCKDILHRKGVDSAGDDEDANRNFAQQAKQLGLTPYRIWSVYVGKHIDRVQNAIYRYPAAPQFAGETIQESAVDIINYMVILLSMLREDKLFHVEQVQDMQ